MTLLRKRVSAQPPLPWLIIGGESCAVTQRWIRMHVGSKRAYVIARETYAWLAAYDAETYLVWYKAGILTPIDRLQDVAVLDRLVDGLNMLTEMYPRSCARAKREVVTQ